MNRPRLMRIPLLGLLPVLFACTPRTVSPPVSTPAQPDRLSEFLGPSTTVDARPAALIDGRAVSWGELRPLLNEAVGGKVLYEVLLDRVLAEAAVEAGLTITDRDLETERQLFYRTLDPDPDQAARIARSYREREGLLRTRFERLLRRNATLRALVRHDVTVSETSVQRMFDSVYGPKRQGRIIVVASLADAQVVLTLLDEGRLFADVAVERSTDASAARGGLLEPISVFDARYDQALRDALWSLEPNTVSEPILLERNYAILMPLHTIEPVEEIAYQVVREEMADLVRLEQERILMDRQARRLVRDVRVTIIDEALAESWKTSRNTRR